MGRCDPVDSGQSAVCGAGNFRAEIPGISDAERSDRHFLHLYLSSAHRNRIVSAWMAFRIPKRLFLFVFFGFVEVVMRVGSVQIAVPHFAFRGVGFAEISAWIGAGAMLMVTYLVYQVRLAKGVSK